MGPHLRSSPTIDEAVAVSPIWMYLILLNEVHFQYVFLFIWLPLESRACIVEFVDFCGRRINIFFFVVV